MTEIGRPNFLRANAEPLLFAGAALWLLAVGYFAWEVSQRSQLGLPAEDGALMGLVAGGSVFFVNGIPGFLMLAAGGMIVRSRRRAQSGEGRR